MRTLSKRGVEFIATFEGFRSHPYQDSGGVWTIGYGHTGGVSARTPPWSRAHALGMLASDAHEAARGVREMLYGHSVNQCEFDALVSQAYNAGVGALAKSPQVRLLKSGRKGSRVAAGAAMATWYIHDAQGHSLLGLIRRRAAERRLFRGRSRRDCGHRLTIY